MSHINNTEFLEAAQEDADQFLAEGRWKDAQAIVDNLFEQGFEHEAVIIRKALIQKQYESTLDVEFVPHVDPVPPVLEIGWQEPTTSPRFTSESEERAIEEGRLKEEESSK